MKEYQLEITQSVDYPRCRIYRDLIQTLMSDRALRAGPNSHLFHYTVLCTYANFRTSYLRLDGITYTIRPGEWLCRVSDLMSWFRVRFQHQALAILSSLQQLRLITFSKLDQSPLIRYRILSWRTHNTVLDYNCPCQKESGFFFMPISITSKFAGSYRFSELDIILDMWLSTIYKDQGVIGSDLGPVVYYRNGTGNPIISFSELAQRWGRSKSSVGRLLKKLSKLGYISLVSFPGRCGSVIYLNHYLSVMFHVDDVLIGKEEVAMQFNIKIKLPDNPLSADDSPLHTKLYVSKKLLCVPKQHISIIVHETAKTLANQGFQCFKCAKAHIKLSPLSVDCQGTNHRSGDLPDQIQMDLVVHCGAGGTAVHFPLSISPAGTIHFERSSMNVCAK